VRTRDDALAGGVVRDELAQVVAADSQGFGLAPCLQQLEQHAQHLDSRGPGRSGRHGVDAFNFMKDAMHPQHHDNVMWRREILTPTVTAQHLEVLLLELADVLPPKLVLQHWQPRTKSAQRPAIDFKSDAA